MTMQSADWSGHAGEHGAGVADVQGPRLVFGDRGRAVDVVSHRGSALSAGQPELRLVDDAG